MRKEFIVVDQAIFIRIAPGAVHAIRAQRIGTKSFLPPIRQSVTVGIVAFQTGSTAIPHLDILVRLRMHERQQAVVDAIVERCDRTRCLTLSVVIVEVIARRDQSNRIPCVLEEVWVAGVRELVCCNRKPVRIQNNVLPELGVIRWIPRCVGSGVGNPRNVERIRVDQRPVRRRLPPRNGRIRPVVGATV